MILVQPGDDVQAAVAAAEEGETVRLAAGLHTGPLRIARRIRLEGEAGSVLEGAGRGTVLTVSADGVVVRDLAVRGSGRNPTDGDAGVLVTSDHVVLERISLSDVLIGFDLQHADDGVLRDCVVRGDAEMPLGRRGDGIRIWESHRNRIERNTLESVRDVLAWYASDNWFVGNVVRGSRYGTHLMHADRNVLAGNRYEDDIVGVFVMYSHDVDLFANRVVGAHGAAGMGLGFKESDAIRATGNQLLGNTVGIYLDTTPHRIGGHAVFGGNRLAWNHTGLRFHGSQTGATFAANDFHENALQVTVDGRSDARDTVFTGNAWSDFTGYDLDRDGYGDLPYTLRSLSGGIAERRPGIAFFRGTPAAALLDLLATAFPMFAPRPVMSDPTPRSR